jgi:hypothetical protein
MTTVEYLYSGFSQVLRLSAAQCGIWMPNIPDGATFYAAARFEAASGEGLDATGIQPC